MPTDTPSPPTAIEHRQPEPTALAPRELTAAEQRNAIICAALEEMISDGTPLRTLAEKHGVPRSTLHRWLLSDVPEKYRPAQVEGLLARIIEADDELDSAKSHVDISRAREKCRFARWDAERRLPNMFSSRQEITGAGGGPIPLELTNLERAQRFVFLQRLAKREEIVIESSDSA